MQGNDLSAEPTRRFWVLSDVVLPTEKRVYEERRWMRTTTRVKEVVAPDLGVLSQLWRWSSSLGVRLELLFVEDNVKDAPEMWQVLERGSANPFHDWVPFETRDKIAAQLAYRPDVAGVIDKPGKHLSYGGKGLTMSVVTD